MRCASRSRAPRSRRSSRAAGRATIVVEPPALPLPGAPVDPRQAALAATIDELARLGVPSQRQTILVAGGLGRRAGGRELEALLSPTARRAFRGKVEAHDVTGELVSLGPVGRRGAARQPAARRHRSRGHRDRGGDRAPRRPGRPGRRRRRRHDPRRRRPVAARDRRLEWLAARPRARTRARGPRGADRRVARAQPAAADRELPRLPLRGQLARAPRGLAAPAASRCSRRWRAARSSRGSGAS